MRLYVWGERSTFVLCDTFKHLASVSDYSSFCFSDVEERDYALFFFSSIEQRFADVPGLVKTAKLARNLRCEQCMPSGFLLRLYD